MKKRQKYFALDSFTQSLCKELKAHIEDVFALKLDALDVAQNFCPPPKPGIAHWAFPCFFLSQKLKVKPNDIATQLAKKLNSSQILQKTQVAGPYLNIFFKPEFIINQLLLPFKAGAFSQTTRKPIDPLLIEFSQPNSHKNLHVGHMRNLCFGHALCALLKKRGFPVKTCTFPGDMGTHVAKCLWYLKFHNKEDPPPHNKGEWLGQIYTQAIRKFESLSALSNQKKKEIEKQISTILEQLSSGKGEFFNLWKKTRAWSLDLMKELYSWTRTKFDQWYWESEVDTPSINWIKALYKKGLLSLSEGAIGCHLGEKLQFFLLLKADGNGLYATKDLYLAKVKWESGSFSRYIYIVDQRQEWHFVQLFETLKHIGYEKEAEKFFHLKYNFVELKNGAMSSRSGNILPIMSLIKKMTAHIKDQYLNKYESEWSAKKIEHTAYMIADGAIKYGMNEQDLNKKIIFDMDQWLKIDGKSGPYMQYAYARTLSLLKKNHLSLHSPIPKEHLHQVDDNLISKAEWTLILSLSWFSLIMEKTAWDLKTSSICHYLYDLSKNFSHFYQNCSIKEEKNLKKKQFRLLLTQVTGIALEELLNSLGIQAPEQM